MKKCCTVTYTTIDQKPRELVWDVTQVSDKVVSNIIAFVKTGEWPKASTSKKNWNMTWGIRVDKSVFSLEADLFGPGYIWKQPNETQYTFYQELAKKQIVERLAMECSMDADFGKAILKQATEAAKKRDQDDELLDRDHRDALNRAKQRVRYYQKKYAADHADAKEYASVIEEYRLFTVLDIQQPVTEE